MFVFTQTIPGEGGVALAVEVAFMAVGAAGAEAAAGVEALVALAGALEDDAVEFADPLVPPASAADFDFLLFFVGVVCEFVLDGVLLEF